jgi:hypothetical protein
MVNHFLFQCQRLNFQQHLLRLSLGKAPFTYHPLLGGRGHTRDLLQYVHDTHQFPLYKNGLLLPTEKLPTPLTFLLLSFFSLDFYLNFYMLYVLCFPLF